MLYIGTSGWWYDDWRGIVYPDRGRTDPLASLARLFNALEINVSFYRDVSHRMAASWLGRINSFEDFRFTAKLHQRFTHQRQEPFAVADVRQSLDGLEPLREAGRLGALLAQFPWSVRDDTANRAWIERLCRACEGFRVVVELRHDSWLREESLGFLRSLGIGMCNIDMPVLEHCVPPTELVLSPVAYVRLHGRNYAKWWQHDHPDQRYDYMYTESELDGWVARIQRIAHQATDTFVFTNNHFRGQAPANALQLRSKLAGTVVEVPATMLQMFPVLAKYAQPSVTERQGELF